MQAQFADLCDLRKILDTNKKVPGLQRAHWTLMYKYKSRHEDYLEYERLKKHIPLGVQERYLKTREGTARHLGEYAVKRTALTVWFDGRRATRSVNDKRDDIEIQLSKDTF